MKSILQSLKAIVVISAVIGVITFWWHKKSNSHKDGLRIGVVQFISHPALDRACFGFIKQLQEKLGDKISCVVQNAEGSMLSTQGIVQRFHADKNIDGIFAIATPAAQAAHAVEHTKPIFIAAVTDPRAAGLLHQGSNVCGSSDMIDARGLVNVLTQLVPSAQRVGIIFNPGEINAVTLASIMRESLLNKGCQVLDVGLSEGGDINLAVHSACNKVDALIAPTDNTVASSIQIIAQAAKLKKIPLIVSDNLLVSQGALAACGLEYEESGRNAADCAIDVLMHGKNPADLEIKKPSGDRIVVNKVVLQQLSLTVPESLMPRVTFVE